jgi:hypothetical protein
MTIVTFYNFTLSETERRAIVAPHNGLAYGQSKTFSQLPEAAKDAVKAAYETHIVEAATNYETR